MSDPLIAAPPKLTCENVMTAVKGVWWYSVGIYLRIPKSKLDEIDRLYSDDSKRCQALIQYWMGLDPFPTWRRVITALGGMLFGEGKERADRIRAYAEPQTGMASVSSRAACDDTPSFLDIHVLYIKLAVRVQVSQ